jgi:hypothetical protein
METSVKFLTLGVELDVDEFCALEEIHESLSRLTGRKKTEITLRPPLSSTAWTVAVYREAVLYRLVSIARGAIITWNAGNVLCSFLAARAFFETFAVMWDYHRTIERAFSNGDLQSISGLTLKQTFASRDEGVLEKVPEIRQTNILTFINKLDGEFHICRRAYDLMSERCHPHSLGTFMMFGNLDAESGVVSYSDRHNVGWAFRLLYNIISLITAAEIIIEKGDKLIIDIDTLERQAS